MRRETQLPLANCVQTTLLRSMVLCLPSYGSFSNLICDCSVRQLLLFDGCFVASKFFSVFINLSSHSSLLLSLTHALQGPLSKIAYKSICAKPLNHSQTSSSNYKTIQPPHRTVCVPWDSRHSCRGLWRIRLDHVHKFSTFLSEC